MQQQHQQQQHQSLPFPQHQPRAEITLPTRDEEFGVSSSDGGVSSTGLLIGGQNSVVQGVVTNGNAVTGQSLAPIILTGPVVGGGGGESSPPSHLEGISADSGPIYALGPLGPFFVAAAGNSSGNLMTLTKGDSPPTNGGFFFASAAGSNSNNNAGGTRCEP